MSEDIEKAKEVLRNAGYYVDNLWHINDVGSVKPGVSEEQAQKILNFALTNEATMEQIWFSIKFEI